MKPVGAGATPALRALRAATLEHDGGTRVVCAYVAARTASAARMLAARCKAAGAAACQLVALLRTHARNVRARTLSEGVELWVRTSGSGKSGVIALSR